jgi:hypothetical protein
VIGVEISATSVAASRVRVERVLGISSEKGRSPGPHKPRRHQHGEIVSPGMGSATSRAMTHVTDRATHKSSALRAKPGRCRNPVQLRTRRLPSPNRSRVRSRKLNTAKVVAVVVAVAAAEIAESGPSKESRAHRAASAVIAAPKRPTPLLRENQRLSRRYCHRRCRTLQR